MLTHDFTMKDFHEGKIVCQGGIIIHKERQSEGACAAFDALTLTTHQTCGSNRQLLADRVLDQVCCLML